MTYGQAMDAMTADHEIHPQREDWPQWKWLRTNRFGVVYVRMEDGSDAFYQLLSDYNLSDDLEHEWELV